MCLLYICQSANSTKKACQIWRLAAQYSRSKHRRMAAARNLSRNFSCIKNSVGSIGRTLCARRLDIATHIYAIHMANVRGRTLFALTEHLCFPDVFDRCCAAYFFCGFAVGNVAHNLTRNDQPRGGGHKGVAAGNLAALGTFAGRVGRAGMQWVPGS